MTSIDRVGEYRTANRFEMSVRGSVASLRCSELRCFQSDQRKFGSSSSTRMSHHTC